MKIVKLIHNPTAGDEEHSEAELKKCIEEAGYECRYSSTKKKDWKEIEDDIDLIAVAGGDGTIRKTVKELLDRHILDHYIPIAVLPLGTANNIAKTLGLQKDFKQLINSWKHATKKEFDIGCIYNIDDSRFFLESFGYGIFPYLMQVVKKSNEKYNSPEEELKGALKKLHEIIVNYEPRNCQLEVDGKDYSGKYILAEIMNTQSIGPKLKLAPNGDPGDGVLDVVLVSEKDKNKFAAFIDQLIKGDEVTYEFTTCKAEKINISWHGTHVHVDDEVIKFEEDTVVNLEVKKGVLQFLVPS